MHSSIYDKSIVPILSVIAIIILFLLYFGSMRSIKTDTIVQPIAQHNPFEQVTLTAQSALVWDVKAGKALYEHNSDTVRPLASLTKVMMAITAADLAPHQTVVAIQKEFLEEEGDSGLFVDERWELKDLVDFSLTTSSNDGSRAIASVIGAARLGSQDFEIGRKEFIEQMNKKSKAIGLEDTYFSNENGLDADETLGGAYGTARDVVKMFEYALRNHPEIMESTKQGQHVITSLNNIPHIAQNTNYTVDSIPGVIASKTGYTNLAGGNLAIAFDPGLGRPIIISVLGSTLDGRFTDVNTLINASRVYLDQQ